MHKTKIDLPEKTRIKINEILQACLVDCLDLMTHAKQAHWTVRGQQFISLHELFDKISEHCAEHADLLAERIAQFGGNPEGTTDVVARTTRLAKYPVNLTAGQDHIKALSTSMASVAALIRAAIDQSSDLKDISTSDLFTEISRGIDKDLWLLEAHL